MTEEQLDEYISESQEVMEKAKSKFDDSTPEEQWDFVTLFREDGELIINNEGTFFKLEEDGLSVELKLKEHCSRKTLLRVFGFNYKINTND